MTTTTTATPVGYDSLVISGAIELMGDAEGSPSILPQCTGAIFTLDVINAPYSFGAPQPTVDVLASLVTDGERPIGRRASDRTIVLPIAILAPDRNTLVAARETLLKFVNAEQWPLVYTRNGGNPLILDCFRAEPSQPTYSVTDEEQLVCSITITALALPYGHSDVPTVINFQSPALGGTIPPAPIKLDSFESVEDPDDQPATWKQSASGVRVEGTHSVYCPMPSGYPARIKPDYKATLGTPQDISQMSSISFWVGFAAPAQWMFEAWPGHKNNIHFSVALTDNVGNKITFGKSQVCSQSRTLSSPNWHKINILIPQGQTFDYTNLAKFEIKAWNHNDGYMWYTNTFLDAMYVLSDTNYVPATVRGVVYQLNVIDGTAHAPLGIAAQQAPATTPTIVTQTIASPFTIPAAVTSLSASMLAPGGAGASVPSTGRGGGGGAAEWVNLSNIPVTPGQAYTPFLPDGGHPLTGAFAGWTQTGTTIAGGTPTTSTGMTTSIAATPVGSASVVVVTTPQPSTVTVTDSAGNGPGGSYQLVSNSTAPDGTTTSIFAAFSVTALTTSSTITIAQNTSQILIASSYTAQGISSAHVPGSCIGSSSDGQSGNTANIYSEIPGYLNANPDSSQGTSGWIVSGTGGTLATTPTPPSGCPTVSAFVVAGTTGNSTTITEASTTPCLPGQVIRAKALANMATQSNMNVQLTVTFYDQNMSQLATHTDTIAVTASTWTSLVGSAQTAPTGTTQALTTLVLVGATTGNNLYVSLVGVVLGNLTNETRIQFLAFANGSSALATGLSTGWTALTALPTNGGLETGVAYLNDSSAGRGGDGFTASYPGGTSWATAYCTFTTSAGQASFTGDNGVMLSALGGVNAPYNSSSAGGGGWGTLTGDAENPGGSGATAPTGFGGGGGSAATGSASSVETDDSSNTITYSIKAPPPLQVGYVDAAGVSSAAFQIPTAPTPGFASNTLNDDVLLVAVLASTTGGNLSVFDSQGNTYNNNRATQKVTIPGTTFTLYLFTANNSKSQNHTFGLQPGDTVTVISSTVQDLAVKMWAWTLGDNATIGYIGDIFKIASGTSASPSITTGGLAQSQEGEFVVFANNAALSTTGGTGTYLSDMTNPGVSNVQASAYYNTASGSGGDTLSGTLSSSNAWAAVLATYKLQQPGAGTVGGWSVASNNSNYFGNGSKYSHLGGRTATISFTGSRIQLVGKIGPDQGIGLVQIDSLPAVYINNYSPTAQWQQIIYDSGLLPTTGAHTCTITVLGYQDPNSSYSWIDFDAYILPTSGAGITATTQTGAPAVGSSGAGGNGGTTNAGGSAGGSPGGGGGGAVSTSGAQIGGRGGGPLLTISYLAQMPAFKTLVLHRPNVDGSKSLYPYIACSSGVPPTLDQVQSITPGIPAKFGGDDGAGTYTFLLAASSFNSPSSPRTVTVAVNEYEYASQVTPSATSSISRTFTPSTDALNNLISIGELTLPNKYVPPENANVIYKVAINDTNGSDVWQDILMLDTMGQTIFINDPVAYAQYFVDAPTPTFDIGRVLGSQLDRNQAISVLDYAYPTGGPLTAEPGLNILFAYAYEGAPALIAQYLAQWFIDRAN